MHKLATAICLSTALIVVAGEAQATNGTCQELRLNLPPIYQALKDRLRQHLWTRDNNLKITVEQDTAAFMGFAHIADRYGTAMENAIRDYNDDDPEAEYLCRKYILQANCEAYHVYQDAVVNLPGINRESVLVEGKRRCDKVEQLPQPQTVKQDENAAVKQAYAATLDRLIFETNRLNLSPISDAEILISAEQKAFEVKPNQQVTWTGPSGKSSGTIAVMKELSGIGTNYMTCRCIKVSIATEYSQRSGTEAFCRINGNWEQSVQWGKVACD